MPTCYSGDWAELFLFTCVEHSTLKLSPDSFSVQNNLWWLQFIFEAFIWWSDYTISSWSAITTVRSHVFPFASSHRYYYLAFRAHQMPETSKENAVAILERAKLEDWALGTTKVTSSWHQKKKETIKKSVFILYNLPIITITCTKIMCWKQSKLSTSL